VTSRGGPALREPPTAHPAPPPPRHALAWSLGVHALALGFLWLLPRLGFDSPPPFEVEITSPFLGTGPARLGAPKPLVPGVPSKVNVTPDVPKPPVEKPPEKAPEPPKDWTLPGPKTRVVAPQEAPEPTPGGAVGGTGTAAKTGGSGEGSDEGVPGGMGDGGARLSALASLKRFYPESERQAGREGAVIVVIHLGADGATGAVDIARSASPAFDEAARKVARLMRFSPAIGLNQKPVPVRMPQEVRFRLTD